MRWDASKGIPSIAIILYNGIEKWNPLDKFDSYPKVLRDIVLPFKSVFVDVDDIDDETCLKKFSPRLGAFMIALKYARNPDEHREIFKKALDRLDLEKHLDLVASIDVYLNGWISKNFEEDFKMDFKRPPYETIADAQRKRQEVLEKQLADKAAELADKAAELAEKDRRIADKVTELAEKDRRIAELEAKLAEK